MKKNIFRISILFVLLIFISSCSSSRPIKIGLVGNFTGPSSSNPEKGKRAVFLAIEEINKSGGINGRPIELMIQDDFNDSKIAIKTAKNFIEDGIDIIIGHYTSTMTKSVFDIINKSKILYISPVANSMLFSKQDDNFIMINATSSSEAEAVYNTASDNGNKNLLLLFNSKNETYGNSLYTALNDAFVKTDGNVQKQSFNDYISIRFDETADSIKQYDGIYIAGNGIDTAFIVKELKGIGYEKNIYLSAWSNGVDLYRLGGNYLDGAYIMTAVNSESQNPKYLAFQEKYTDLYGESPNSSAIYSYDTMMLIAENLRKIKKYSAKNLKAEILNSKEFKGLETNCQINEFGDSTRVFYPMIIKDGVAISIND